MVNDQPKDRRPHRLLRKCALISQRRKDRFGEMPDSLEQWWQQINEAAADLQLQTSARDWERWVE
jgi:hypothetical protein